MDVDIVIIGAGPAGCAAAIVAVQSGLSALIIAGKNTRHDSANLTIQPSESIHPGVLSLLELLQAGPAIAAASVGVYEGVQTGETLAPLGSSADGDPWLGNHIHRHRFDKALLDAALLQGAGILQPEMVSDLLLQDDCVVGIKTMSGNQITCKYVIDASGYMRFGGKKLQFEEAFDSLPLTAWTGVTENIPPDHFLYSNRFTRFIPNPGGWTWLAPESGGRCTWTMLSAKGKQSVEPPGELTAFTNQGKIKAANCRWRIFRPVCKEGIILCGDAAAIVDPAAGQGILNALLSGMTASKTVVSCISDPDQEPIYLAEYDNWFFQYYQDRVQKLKTHYADLGIAVF